MAKAQKSRASKTPYVRPSQPTLVGFESPFARTLSADNRWVSLAHKMGYYPKEVLVDKIYCTRENRAKLKALGIALIAKPPGRPPALKNHIRPGERNPIEGKFNQAKTAYGMNRIKATLQQTSESWIATIIMVRKLVKLTGQVSYWVK